MSRLNEIEARARNAALMIDIGPTSEKEWAACASACNDVPDMAAALRAVLNLHPREVVISADAEYGLVEGEAICAECIVNYEPAPYPCPTVAAIRRYLGDDL